MSTFWFDLRYAARTLRKAPGFTLAAVALLSVGIAATSAMFTLVDTVLFKPLPFAEPGRLTMVWEVPPGRTRNSVSPLNFLDWSEQNRSFVGMTAVSGGNRTLTTVSGEAELIRGQAVSPSFFDVFGMTPLLGRTFVPADDHPGTDVVVLGEGLWRRRFGGDAAIVGRAITLDGTPMTVVGVIRDTSQVLFRSELWTPFVVKRSPEQRRMHYLRVFGRLKPGVTLEQARDDMRGLGQQIASSSPETNRGWSVLVEPLRQALVGEDLRATTMVFGGVGGFVLLMACANVANLMLARGLGRRREIAVRGALGGSRARILRQFAAESGLVALVSGVVGVGLAWALIAGAPAFMPPGTLPASIRFVPDARLMAVAALVTALTAVLFGLAPAWQAARVSLVDAMGSGSRTSTRGGRLRGSLVVAQIASAVLITCGAGLLARTVWSLTAVDPGYREHSVLTMSFTLPLSRYETPERALRFYEAVERDVSALPGVVSASMGGALPMDGSNIGQGYAIVGDPPPVEASRPSAHYQMVGARYFETLGIDIVRGRGFTDRDNAALPPICIVNEEFVRRHFSGRDPIGRRISISAMDMKGPQSVEREIVGVSRQVKVDGAGERQPTVEVYVPIAQNPWFWATLVVRTANDPLAAVPAIKAVVAGIDPEQPIAQVRTIDEVADATVAVPRFRAVLVGALAAISLGLAAAGIFAVLTLSVHQRRQELGVRVALGARAGHVLRLVLGSGLRLILVGTIVGLALASVLARSAASLLFGVQPTDPVTFILAPTALTVVALVACAAPAIRAARVDPAIALRE